MPPANATFTWLRPVIPLPSYLIETMMWPFNYTLASPGARSAVLTHLLLVLHICVSKWLVAYSTPSHYLNQCWVIVNWTLRNKLQWNLKKLNLWFIKMCLKVPRNGSHFVQGRWVNLKVRVTYIRNPNLVISVPVDICSNNNIHLDIIHFAYIFVDQTTFPHIATAFLNMSIS